MAVPEVAYAGNVLFWHTDGQVCMYHHLTGRPAKLPEGANSLVLNEDGYSHVAITPAGASETEYEQLSDYLDPPVHEGELNDKVVPAKHRCY
eukprot:5104562-Amphidinium_carterae.2